MLFPHKKIIVEFIHLVYFNRTQQKMYDSENKWKVGLLKFSSKISSVQKRTSMLGVTNESLIHTKLQNSWTVIYDLR